MSITSSPRADVSVAERIAALGPWFHNLVLDGAPTAPAHPLGDYPANHWRWFADALPADLTGATVLDIGCNAGFFSFEMKRRGAARVVGIDYDADYLAQARFAAEVLGVSGVTFRQMSVYDVAALGERFDVVLFLGVFYHLRHPLLALDLIHEHAARDLLLFQSMQRGADKPFEAEPDYAFEERAIFHDPAFPKLHFIEQSYAGDPTNWFVPNRAGAEAMLRAAGFTIEAHPCAEVYLCRRTARSGPGAVHPARPGDEAHSPTIADGAAPA